jgi:DNA-binding response OmpR family regulator
LQWGKCDQKESGKSQQDKEKIVKVLIIDDSKFHCMALRRSLASVGHEVITAGDGEQGLRVANETVPDLIVLDMMLPKVSGVEVLRALRRNKSTEGVPVIVLTALSERNREKLLGEGATGYIEKSAALFSSDCVSLLSAVTRSKGGPNSRN